MKNITSDNIELRTAVRAHLPLMLAWRNNPEIYRYYYQQSTRPSSAIRWEEHVAWFSSRNADWKTFIIELLEKEDIPSSPASLMAIVARPIGVLTIGILDHWEADMGIYIGETSLWGQGAGRSALKLGVQWLRQYAKDHTHLVAAKATIMNGNERARRLFQSEGFERVCAARPGESQYRLWLSAQVERKQ
jgi:RimJ/RimL family protein N-acetyltransferase